MKKRQFVKDYTARLSGMHCSYCNHELYHTKAAPNEHWCSNPKCPKGIAFGLGAKQ